MDIVRSAGQQVIQILDVETNFQKAICIRGKSSNALCNAFVECCASIYTGLSESIKLERESSFVSEEFRTNGRDV